MVDKQFHDIFSHAVSLPADGREAFLDYWMHRGVEIEQDDIPNDINYNFYLLDQLESIWDIAHLSVRDIRRHTGLTQRKFCDKFCIPYRSLEDWERGISKCPPYLRLMLAQLVGAFNRKNF